MLFLEPEERLAVSKAFRPIYYLGCKAGLASSIATAINEVDPSRGRVLDLFAGSGAVSSFLASDREVTSVDIQEYSRVLCSAMLNPFEIDPTFAESISRNLGKEASSKAWCFEPMILFEERALNSSLQGDLGDLALLLESPPLIAYIDEGYELPPNLFGVAIQETIARLNQSGLANSKETLVARSFGGTYFSFEQAIILDAALCVAEGSTALAKDTLKAIALSVASAIVNTVGKQFAQPIQPRNKTGDMKLGIGNIVYKDRSLNALEAYKEWMGRYSELLRTQKIHKAIRSDYLEALATCGQECSVVYADPPYTRDHYSRFYHVLETMCLRDNPVTSKVTRNGQSLISRGVYRKDRHQSPFCIRSTALAAFEALFEGCKRQNLPLVLSYSPHEEGDGTHPRVVSIGQIIEAAHDHYHRVDVVAVDGVTHNLLNRNELKLKKRDHAEVILKCFA